jgi:hypothetical protein
VSEGVSEGGSVVQAQHRVREADNFREVDLLEIVDVHRPFRPAPGRAVDRDGGLREQWMVRHGRDLV